LGGVDFCVGGYGSGFFSPPPPKVVNNKDQPPRPGLFPPGVVTVLNGPLRSRTTCGSTAPSGLEKPERRISLWPPKKDQKGLKKQVHCGVPKLAAPPPKKARPPPSVSSPGPAGPSGGKLTPKTAGPLTFLPPPRTVSRLRVAVEVKPCDGSHPQIRT